jgi:hypothetical protein
MAVYNSLLADIPDEVLVAAAEMHAVNSRFFPSVAELREAAMDIIARARGILTPEEAWVATQRAVARYGYYGESISPEDGGGWRVPRCLDEMTRTAIDGLGGWHAVCHSENAAADRAHFLRIYGGLVATQRQQVTALPHVQAVIAQLAGKMNMRRLEGPDHD